MNATDSTQLDEILVPTVAQYVKAFRAIESRITIKQREMLRFHHRAPGRVVSATRLAEEAGHATAKRGVTLSSARRVVATNGGIFVAGLDDRGQCNSHGITYDADF